MNYKIINLSYQDLITNIKTYFQDEKNITLFQKRNTIKIVIFQNKQYVVKSFKIPHLLNQIVYKFFRDSKAKRSYENSVKLINLNINTPKPIGYIEFSSPFLFQESFYISEFFNYDFEIRAVFNDKEFKDREKILKEFIIFSYDLHQKGIYHIDYSPGNILVKQENSSYIFSIIDVNRMKFLKMDIKLKMKSLSKLTKDDEDNTLLLHFYHKVSNIPLEELEKDFQYALLEEKAYLEKKKRLKKLQRKS